jgi:hypothetical protein
MYHWVRFGGLFLALVILLAPWGAGAAEVPTLTLQQLTAKALEFSPEVKASKSEVRFAKEQVEEVKGYYYPQLDATGIGGLAPKAKRPYVDVYGERGAIVYQPPSNVLHGVTVFGRLDLSVVKPLYTLG